MFQTFMLDTGTIMMELAGLSFLGLGAKPPIAEWGSMMSNTRSLMNTAPWITFAPGVAIFISVIKGAQLRKAYQKMQMVFQTPADSFDPRCTLGDGIGESLRNHGVSAGEAQKSMLRIKAAKKRRISQLWMDSYLSRTISGLLV